MGIILSYSIELLGMHLTSYEGRRYRLVIGHGMMMSWGVGSSFLLERPLEKTDPTVEIQLRSILQLDRSKGYQLGAYWRISTVGCILYRAMTLTVEFVPEQKYPPDHTLRYSMSDFDRTTFFVPASYVKTVITPHLFASPASYSLPTGRAPNAYMKEKT